jgi:hypothetical protein
MLTFYSRLGNFSQNYTSRLGDYGNVTERQLLRDRLNCKSFEWYLDNVAPRVPRPRLIGAGELRNPASGLCLDKNDRVDFVGQTIDAVPCDNSRGLHDNLHILECVILMIIFFRYAVLVADLPRRADPS